MKKKHPYANCHQVVKFTSELLLPPRRLKPSVATVQSLRNDKGAYDPNVSPMMAEPLDIIGSREYTGIVFVGPARSSKTYSLLFGGLTYVQTCAPGDALIIQMTREAASDFSHGDLDKVIRHSPDLKTRLRVDNTFDKRWRTGTSLKIGWPAVSQLSSKTLQYVFITDYDRPECRDDVDGEGSMWDLAYKRIETYMSRGKCLAESSPGEEFTDPQWHPSTPHEAPPAPGILTLYNRGTRARWYWPCLHCNFYFEAKPGLDLFRLPMRGKELDFEEVQRMVRKKDPVLLAEDFGKVACPDCGAVHTMADRSAMNMRGTWVHEGQKIDEYGKPVGNRRRSSIASYWLGGVAATYQRWDSLLEKYFNGVLAYTRSGDETGLKATTMTDQGVPYMSQLRLKARGPDELLARREQWEKGTVPTGVRYLVASVDVQAHKFVASVFGFGIAMECWYVDRFDISTSRREEAPGRVAALDPSAYAEDWLQLIENVVLKKYPMAEKPEVELPIMMTCSDSGGKEGVTLRAYDFWRTAVRARGLQKVFQLIKGDPRLTVPRLHLTYPDNRDRKTRHSNARGDVPVWLLNVNLIKDGIANDLARTTHGEGYVHLPLWVDRDIIEELTAEVRGPDGWEKRHNARNEQLDLHTYARAACGILRAESIDWSRPPVWAIDPFIRLEQKTPDVDIAALARSLNGGS